MVFFSENLRLLRRLKNVSQTQLGNIFNSNAAVIASYESGRNFPSIENLIKIAEFFQLTLDDLVRTDIGTEGLPNKTIPNNQVTQMNENGNNHAVFNHTESDWKVIEEQLKSSRQRVVDLESQINALQKYIALLEGDAKK